MFIAAAASATGASALVLDLCRHGHARAVSSRLVLLESERNIRRKFGADTLLRFYQEIAALQIDLLVETPTQLTQQEVTAQSGIIDPRHWLVARAPNYQTSLIRRYDAEVSAALGIGGAHHFGVSRLAALYRLRNLRMVKGAEFELLNAADESGQVCRSGRATAVTSQLVLLESEQNIRTKLGGTPSCDFISRSPPWTSASHREIRDLDSRTKSVLHVDL